MTKVPLLRFLKVIDEELGTGVQVPKRMLTKFSTFVTDEAKSIT